MNGYKIVLLKAIFMLYRLPESERVCSGICTLWFPKLVDIFKQKSRFLEYIYSHVCDYNLNRMTIEANTEKHIKTAG